MRSKDRVIYYTTFPASRNGLIWHQIASSSSNTQRSSIRMLVWNNLRAIHCVESRPVAKIVNTKSEMNFLLTGVFVILSLPTLPLCRQRLTIMQLFPCDGPATIISVVAGQSHSNGPWMDGTPICITVESQNTHV